MEKKRKTPQILLKLSEKKLELFAFFLISAVFIVILWPFITITIEAGYVGVYYSRLSGGTVLNKTYGEGLHFLLPWDKITPYDSRAQSKDYNITGLAMGGLRVNIDMSVIWYIKKDSASILHTTMGPDYVVNVIDPSVVSVVRSVIGNYEQSRLYDGSPLVLQEDVMTLLGETLKEAPFYIHSILIREVKLPEQMTEAISEKFVAEQNVLSERYKVLEAIENYKRSFVEAEGIRIKQSVINDGMSEAYLRYKGIEATLELSKSQNAKLVIIGDKDGLPLILNPDTLEVSDTMPEGLSSENSIETENVRMQEFIDTYNRMQHHLNTMNDVLGELFNAFPESDEYISASETLPQINKVPTSTEED